MTRKELAMENFRQGYNCTQAVVLAFADLLPYDKNLLSQMACGFGGGMGRLREVCGAFSGVILTLNLLEGYSTPETGEVKATHYAKIQSLAKTFEEQHGSLVCRTLLGLTEQHSIPVPEARTPDFYKKRPCIELIGSAAEILDNYLQK